MIYIAGPFFTEKEKSQLNEMIAYARKAFPGEELFIPMEHVVPGGNDKDADGNYIMPNPVWGHEVFKLDMVGLQTCDKMLVLYNGHYSDTGTAWETGYAYAKGMKVYVYVPDDVTVCSCMVMNGCTEIISNNINEQK